MKKIAKGLAWIVLFPFMLTFWGWKKKNKLVMIVGSILSVLFILVAAFSDTPNNEEAVVLHNSGEPTEISEPIEVGEPDQEDISDQEAAEADLEEEPVPVPVEEATVPEGFEGYQLIEVDVRDLSGHREANVVVDIGYGDRVYYAFTNEYGQLVKVTAEEIVLQDDSTEPVLDSGRYYPYEAKVPGVESSTLEEGHIIADCLGGVSNAYNITPQNSTLNRHVDQAYMEKGIREVKK